MYKFKSDINQKSQDQKRNFREVEILENQVLVFAKFVNRQKLKFEFRLLKNFKKLFEKEAKYNVQIDQYDHGFERIQAFSEVKNISNH